MSTNTRSRAGSTKNKSRPSSGSVSPVYDYDNNNSTQATAVNADVDTKARDNNHYVSNHNYMVNTTCNISEISNLKSSANSLQNSLNNFKLQSILFQLFVLVNLKSMSPDPTQSMSRLYADLMNDITNLHRFLASVNTVELPSTAVESLTAPVIKSAIKVLDSHKVIDGATLVQINAILSSWTNNMPVEPPSIIVESLVDPASPHCSIPIVEPTSATNLEPKPSTFEVEPQSVSQFPASSSVRINTIAVKLNKTVNDVLTVHSSTSNVEDFRCRRLRGYYFTNSVTIYNDSRIYFYIKCRSHY